MIPQTYRCPCGQTNVRRAPHCGRCQLPNPELVAVRAIDAQMAEAARELAGLDALAQLPGPPELL